VESRLRKKFAGAPQNPGVTTLRNDGREVNYFFFLAAFLAAGFFAAFFLAAIVFTSFSS
jgi:hypothetical protein